MDGNGEAERFAWTSATRCRDWRRSRCPESRCVNGCLRLEGAERWLALGLPGLSNYPGNLDRVFHVMQQCGAPASLIPPVLSPTPNLAHGQDDLSEGYTVLTKTPFSKYLKWSGFSLVKHEMGWRLNSSRVLLSNAQASRKSSPTCRGIWLLTVLQADADFREKRPCLSCTWERKVFWNGVLRLLNFDNVP